MDAWVTTSISANHDRRFVASRATIRYSEPVTRSYVEGDEFEDPVAEIDALGGDPFFLQDDDDKGGSNDGEEGDFLWDGEVDENAHLDLDLD